MAFGVLEHTTGPSQPGTTVLEDTHNGSSKADIVLVLELITSPHDPLNMSRVRKELLFLTIIFGTCATGVIGPLLVPGFSIIATAFKITLTQITLLNGSLVMALGVSSYLCSIFAVIWGKRLVYLITTIMLMAMCCWGAAAQSYSSLLAARCFQGLSMGGFFGLAGTASINDVFFVHQRGRRVGMWNCAVIVSVNITPVISGYLIVGLSWQWSFWILAITFGVVLLCVILFFPETSFDRPTAALHAIHSDLEAKNSELDSQKGHDKPEIHTLPDYAVGQSSQPIPAWRKPLGIRNLEFKDPKRIIYLTISPISLLRHPAVVWGCLMWAVTFT